MKKIEKRFDRNAHIENLKYEITTKDNMCEASIEFDNLNYGTIVALKLDACGYNSFGDSILIDGNKNFTLVIQDIKVEKNKHVHNLKVKLPNEEIRKLELKEKQVCYEDGSIITYEGPDEVVFNLEEFDTTIPAEKEQLTALHTLYEPNVKYKVCESDDGWVCSCGRLNKKEDANCSRCSKNKESAEKVFTDAGLSVMVDQYHAHQAVVVKEEQKIEEVKTEEKAKNNKKKFIGIAAVCAILLAFLIGKLLFAKPVYNSETAMKNGLNGVYTYSENSKVKQYVSIYNTAIVTKEASSTSTDMGKITEWNYKKNKFVTTKGTYKVLSDGKIKNESGKVFTRISSSKTTSTASSSSSSTKVESAATALKISDVSKTNNSLYTVCTGKITNNGSKTYTFVKVKGAFTNSAGKVVDTAWTYAVGAEGLAPGESSTFRMSISKDLSVKSVTVTLLSYK